MLLHDLVERSLETIGIQGTFDQSRAGHVVRRTLRIQLMQQPHAFLRERQRQCGRAIHPFARTFL